MGFNLSLPPPFIDPICWSCGFCLVLPGLHREFFSRREECGQNTLYCLEPLKARGEHKRSDSVESAVVLKGPCQLLLRPRGLLQYVFYWFLFMWLPQGCLNRDRITFVEILYDCMLLCTCLYMRCDSYVVSFFQFRLSCILIIMNNKEEINYELEHFRDVIYIDSSFKLKGNRCILMILIRASDSGIKHNVCCLKVVSVGRGQGHPETFPRISSLPLDIGTFPGWLYVESHSLWIGPYAQPKSQHRCVAITDHAACCWE